MLIGELQRKPVSVNNTINKFHRKHLCRSLFLEHMPHFQCAEPMRNVASKNSQLADHRATPEHITEPR